jgi:hypothetical protein
MPRNSEILRRVGQYTRDAIAEHSLTPLRSQILRFFDQIQRFPPGYALGLHGTTNDAVSSIVTRGLTSHSFYYRVDPNQDPVLREDLRRGDLKQVLRKLECTVEWAATWGPRANRPHPAIVLFTTPSRAGPLPVTPPEFPFPATNEGKVDNWALLAHVTSQPNESQEQFVRRAIRTLLHMTLQPTTLADHLRDKVHGGSPPQHPARQRADSHP